MLAAGVRRCAEGPHPGLVRGLVGGTCLQQRRALGGCCGANSQLLHNVPLQVFTSVPTHPARLPACIPAGRMRCRRTSWQKQVRAKLRASSTSRPASTRKGPFFSRNPCHGLDACTKGVRQLQRWKRLGPVKGGAARGGPAGRRTCWEQVGGDMAGEKRCGLGVVEVVRSGALQACVLLPVHLAPALALCFPLVTRLSVCRRCRMPQRGRLACFAPPPAALCRRGARERSGPCTVPGHQPADHPRMQPTP